MKIRAAALVIVTVWCPHAIAQSASDLELARKLPADSPTEVLDLLSDAERKGISVKIGMASGAKFHGIVVGIDDQQKNAVLLSDTRDVTFLPLAGVESVTLPLTAELVRTFRPDVPAPEPTGVVPSGASIGKQAERIADAHNIEITVPRMEDPSASCAVAMGSFLDALDSALTEAEKEPRTRAALAANRRMKVESGASFTTAKGLGQILFTVPCDAAISPEDVTRRLLGVL